MDLISYRKKRKGEAIAMAQGGPGLKQEGKTGIRRDNSLDLGVGENLLNEAGAHLIT